MCKECGGSRIYSTDDNAECARIVEEVAFLCIAGNAVGARSGAEEATSVSITDGSNAVIARSVEQAIFVSILCHKSILSTKVSEMYTFTPQLAQCLSTFSASGLLL